MNPDFEHHPATEIVKALDTLHTLSEHLDHIGIHLHRAGWKSYEDQVRPRFATIHRELFNLLAELHVAFTVDEIIARQADGRLADRKCV